MKKISVLYAAVFAAILIVSTAQGQDKPAPKEVFERMCGSCHGTDLVTNERHSKTEWAGIVDDMVGRGAQGSDAEIAQVVDYLTANYGVAPSK